MKKYRIILVSVFAAVMLVWLIGRLTNALQYYSVPTKSNEPTYKTGNHFLASNLKTPKRLDFICYKITDPEFGLQTWFHRICGMPGDTVEIRKGDLFVNGISQDQSFNVKKLYTIPIQLVTDLEFEEGEVIAVGKDSVIAPLETIKHKDLIQRSRRYTNDIYDYTEIQKIYGQPWFPNNFGPYIVPADSYFVLADNRDNSRDSRFTGPVLKKNYVTTLLR